jgi:tetratricopeptide (TPR) repeat protein
MTTHVYVHIAKRAPCDRALRRHCQFGFGRSVQSCRRQFSGSLPACRRFSQSALWANPSKGSTGPQGMVGARVMQMLPDYQRGIAGATLLIFLFIGMPVAQAQSQLQPTLAKCEESDAHACLVAARSALPPKQASEAYTFWADTFPNQFGNTAVPIKLLRKALDLDPNNALATYLLAVYLPNTDYKLAEEKEKLLKRAAQLRPAWEAPHVQLALLADQWGYQRMIEEWTAALKLGPDDPVYAAKLKEAREKFAAQKLDLAEKEAKAKADPKDWAIQVVYSAKFMCDVPKAEEWTAKYNEFHRDGHHPALVLADTYSACGQPEKARAMYRDVIARYEKWVNSGLSRQEAIQVQMQQLAYLDLLPEANRMHIILNTIFARDKDWWRVKVECEEAEQRGVPTPQLFAQHANALIQGTPPGYEMELQSVLEKALKLDPKFLEEHPEFRPHFKGATNK